MLLKYEHQHERHVGTRNLCGTENDLFMKSQDIMLRKMGYSIFYLNDQIKYFLCPIPAAEEGFFPGP